MQVGGRDHVLRLLLDHLSVVAATYHRHPLPQVLDRTLDRARVRGLDLLPLPRIAQRPHHRHRLRCAERHIDPATPRAIRTRRTQPPAGARVPALHQGDEIPPGHRPGRINAEPLERVRTRQPPSGRLGQLAIRRQVVVATLWRDCLALEISGVAATPPRTDARSAHHGNYRPRGVRERHRNQTPIAPPCIRCVCGLAVKSAARQGVRGALVGASVCSQSFGVAGVRSRGRHGAGMGRGAAAVSRASAVESLDRRRHAAPAPGGGSGVSRSSPSERPARNSAA